MTERDGCWPCTVWGAVYCGQVQVLAGGFGMGDSPAQAWDRTLAGFGQMAHIIKGYPAEATRAARVRWLKRHMGMRVLRLEVRPATGPP